MVVSKPMSPERAMTLKKPKLLRERIMKDNEYDAMLLRRIDAVLAAIEKEESYGRGIPAYVKKELEGRLSRVKALRRLAHRVEDRMPGFMDFASAALAAGMREASAENLVALISAYGALWTAGSSYGRQSWT